MRVKRVKHKGVNPQTFAWALMPDGTTKNRIELFKFRSEALMAAKANNLPKRSVVPVVVETCAMSNEHFLG